MYSLTASGPSPPQDEGRHELTLRFSPQSKCHLRWDSLYVPGARATTAVPSVRCCDALLVRRGGTLVCSSLRSSPLPCQIEVDLAVVCHSPVVSVGQYKAMYDAEMNRKAHPGAVRFSTWRCSLCPNRPPPDQSVLVGSSLYDLYLVV